METKPKIKIFLVDDDELYVKGLKKYLQRTQSSLLEVRSFTTGEACLKEMSRQLPHIIILDYCLNSVITSSRNGVAILKKILLRLPETPVIMLSSQDNVEIALSTLNNGAYDYVVKNESAFPRIDNFIKNIALNFTMTKSLENEDKKIKWLNGLIVCVVILLFILSRLI